MVERVRADGRDYRRGYRDALGMIMRGLLGVEADALDLGALVAALSGYEEQVEAWLAAVGDDDPPAWGPTAEELSAGAG